MSNNNKLQKFLDKKSTYRKDLVDWTYISICSLIAGLSKAVRTKTAAIIVTKDRRIVSTGVNGMPGGIDGSCEDVLEDGSLKTKPFVIHAENNALINLVKTGSGANIDGATMYTLYSPCEHCSALILQSGIKRVVYLYEYRITTGLEMLKSSGVELIKFPLTKAKKPKHLEQILDIMQLNNNSSIAEYTEFLENQND